MRRKEVGVSKDLIGRYAFIVGLLISVIVGLWSGFGGLASDSPTLMTVYGVLVILGLIVGLLNISGEEEISFLVATVALMLGVSLLSPGFSLVGGVDKNLANFMASIKVTLAAITYFIAPAAIVVAILSIFRIARD